MSDEPRPPSPERIQAMLGGFQQTAIVKGAIDLDLFTMIGGGAPTADEIAARCSADPRAIQILCNALTIMGLLEKQGEGYRQTGDTRAFLDRASPTYMGSVTEFTLAPEMVSPWWEIAQLVRQGGPSHLANISPENPVWVKFARGMAPMMAMPAKLLAGLVMAGGRPRRILDIAAGHGLYGIEMAKLAPDSRVTALDWPQVLEVAKQNASAVGLAERWTGLPGSAFDVEFGEGWDLILLTNFLHHFDPDTCEALLRKVHHALAPGGRAVTLEFIPNEDGISPPVPAMFNVVMLVTTPKGRAFRFSELQALHQAAGFARCELHELPPSPERVVIGCKA
jgi:SAM-dependent methyltransferase